MNDNIIIDMINTLLDNNEWILMLPSEENPNNPRIICPQPELREAMSQVMSMLSGVMMDLPTMTIEGNEVNPLEMAINLMERSIEMEEKGE